MSEDVDPQNDNNEMDFSNVNEECLDYNELQSKLAERQQMLTNFQLNSNTKDMDNEVDKQSPAPTISGADIYTTVLNKKRKRSPNTRVLVKNQKELKSSNATITKNRFSIFNLSSDKPKKDVQANNVTNEKPTPFYVRGEKNTSEIRKWMRAMDIKDFDIKVLYNGHEAKLQVRTIDDYRKVQNFFTENSIPNYTYQLKSARSLRAVIKGLDPRIENDEIKNALIELKFYPRNVYQKSNIVFVELEPCDTNGKVHEIFKVERLLNMVVKIEEPKKNNQPKQCYNCQEYGHTKNRCFLTSICAICAEKHATNQCDKDKKDKSAKKCNNCGENHTANWKGCKVYQVLHERLNPKQRREQRTAKNQQTIFSSRTSQRPMVDKTTKGISYANVVSGNMSNATNNNNAEAVNINDLIKLMFAMQANIQTLQTNICEIIKKQNLLENSLLEISKTLNKIHKQK